MAPRVNSSRRTTCGARFWHRLRDLLMKRDRAGEGAAEKQLPHGPGKTSRRQTKPSANFDSNALGLAERPLHPPRRGADARIDPSLVASWKTGHFFLGSISVVAPPVSWPV